jgi:hypothetical protein
MKRFTWQLALGSSLVVISTLLYVEQIRIFQAPRDTFFYLFQDLAFVPIQVLLVTVIVDRVLRIRERMALLKKLNMVIGSFFSEVGTGLLKFFLEFDEDIGSIRDKLIVRNDWTDQRFSACLKDVRAYAARMNCGRGDLAALKEFMAGRRTFLLGLLENQNLLEHEAFTELLWAVFHLMEELSVRENVTNLARPDCEHIAGDIKRAYVILIAEWLAYLKHLKHEYPYLFSLAVRTNPFDSNASPEVR